MAEHPIIFQGWGVQAILAGLKWETRRVIKPQPPTVEAVRALAGAGYHWFTDGRGESGEWRVAGPVWAVKRYGYPRVIRCPYGVPGDVLWVREGWAIYPDADENPVCVYRATDQKPDDVRWRPSIHMPRDACRLTRPVVDIRAQRVQDISTADIIAEGLSTTLRGQAAVDHLEEQWMNTWDGINASPRRAKRNPYTRAREDCFVSYPWDELRETRAKAGLAWYVVGNPWTWAVTFEGQ